MAFPNFLFGSDGDQFTTSTVAATSLNSPQIGDQMIFEDGRHFRWASADGTTAVVVGKLYQSAIPVTNHVLQTAAAAAVGATSIALTLGATAATANQYQNGYVSVDLVGNSGFGYLYGIGLHPAVASAGVFTIPLKSTVQVAIATTANSLSLIANRYSAVILAVATNPTADLAGVSVKPLAVNNWGWLATRGPAICLTVTPVVAIGTIAMAASTTGAVMAQSTAVSLTVPTIGTGIRTAVTASYCTVDLNILDS